MVLGHNIEDGERTQDIQISQGVTFDSMLLATNTLLGLKSSGFYKPSPIQLHGIPVGKCGFDLLLEAKSGTGKTAVFSIIALEQLDMTKGLQAVILAPTREIAAQVCDVTKQIGSHYEGLKVEVVMGGLPVLEDIAKFKDGNVHIVVGSPGRLRHLIQDNHIDISSIRLLVLDEADKLLEKSFIADINYIFSILPKQKQVIMSSATYPEETKTFIKKYVQNAQHVCPESNSILLGITQKVTVVKYNVNIVKQTEYRFEELLKILSKHAFKQCLIFCNYQARVGELHKLLKRHKWPAEKLYGQQEQLNRLDALKSLQAYKCRILISTDLAARGIDASNVDLVINFEPPFEWQTYLHRIGRAGRYGSYGLAITILSKGNEQQKFIGILSKINAPINLTNLWEDKNNITKNTEEASSSIMLPAITELAPVDLKDFKSEKLWNLLTSDLKNFYVEDFQNLCDSFNLSENIAVESFTDLINSLEIHQHKTNKNGKSFYHHLKMQKFHIPQLISSICPFTLIFTKNKKINEIQIDGIENNKSIIEEINEAEDTSEENGTSDEENVISTRKSKNSPKNKKHHKDNNRTHITNINKAYIVENSKEYNYMQYLEKAGLPTSFGNSSAREKDIKISKHQWYIPNHRDHANDYTERSKVNNRNRLSYKDTEDSDTSQGFYNIRTNKSHLHVKKSYKPIRTSGYEVDDENYDNGCNTVDQPDHYYETGTYKKQSNQNHCNKESLEYSSDDDTLSEEKYHDWYKKLKSTVIQVQQAIYIEEMTRLSYK